jgi:lysophospholipase L1-like esterase
MRAALIAVLSVFGLSAASAAPIPRSWVAVWGAAPTPPNLVATPRLPPSARYSNQTIRQVVRVSAGGAKLRVRFSNEYGTTPLQVGAAEVGLPAADGVIRPGTHRVLTFGGRPTAVVPPGAPLLSDPVDLRVEALGSLAVSLYLPGETGPCTCHPIGLATGLVADGDASHVSRFPTKSTITTRAFLSRVEVASPAKSIVVLGDSISDGNTSTVDADRRWPDRLAERLRARDGDAKPWGIVNAGISGNRLLNGGAGEAALTRFDRDVLAVPGVTHVVVFLGVNDLGLAHGPAGAGQPGPKLTSADMIAGYRQLIERAHARGLKVYGATITPYEGAAYWAAQGEADRQAINSWIRTSGAYDGVIDFDAVWRDPQKPTAIRAGFGAADHLHGTDAGYRALGDAVDLGLFR